MNAQIENRIFFFIIVAFTAYVGYLLLQPYFGVIIFSFVTVLTFKPVYDFFNRRVKNRPGIATGLTITAIFLIVLIPIGLIINIAVVQALQFSDDVSSFVGGNNLDSTSEYLDLINSYLTRFPYLADYTITTDQIVDTIRNIAQPVASFLGQNAISIGSNAAELLTRFFIFLVMLATLFPTFPRVVQLIKDLSPLDDALDERYLNRAMAMTVAMVKGVFVIAIAQGVTLGVFLFIAGVPYAFFWTILAIFTAVLPLGVNVVAVPIGIVLLILGSTWQGIIVLIGGLLVAGNVDNILRPRLVAKEAELNPALVILSAFGGLNLFGVLGVIYGPVIMIFLITTVEIYLEHYRLTHPIAETTETLEAGSSTASNQNSD